VNNILTQAGRWLNELGIGTEANEARLRVSRADTASLVPGTVEEQKKELLGEMRSALETNKIYWDTQDENWLYLGCF
jgi:hypothetical protein